MLGRLVLVEAFNPLKSFRGNNSEAPPDPIDPVVLANMQPFDAYIPPTGMQINWYWDIPESLANKYKNDIPSQNKLVLALFTIPELRLSGEPELKDGDIKHEVENNRCFNYLETIPFNKWSDYIDNIPEFQKIFTAKCNPNVTEEILTNNLTEEFKASIPSEAYEYLSQMRLNKQMSELTPVKELPETDKTTNVKEGRKEVLVTVDYVELHDYLRPETD